MKWLQLNLIANKDNVETLSDALTSVGAVAITLEKSNAQHIFELTPDHKPMWNEINLQALFPENLTPHKIQEELSTIIDFNNGNWCTIVEEDWINKWQEYAKPMEFANDLWICPSWCNIPKPSAKNITIDPEMAFGTGSHATTSLCLDWIARNVKTDISVIDYGCGSGVLGIAAAKFGANPIYLVDIDPIALEVTQNNAKKNAVDGANFNTYLPADLPKIQVDLVIANILAHPLIDLAPTLAALLKPNAQIILSGILEAQAQLVIDKYASWFRDFETTVQDGWVRITALLS